LIEDKNARLIDHLKTIIVDKLNDFSDESSKVNFPEYLSEKLGHEYNSLSKLFSEIQGTTIEKFIIAHKIEKVKELIIYGELNLTEIAWKLNYSSVSHLSNQFKKVTGLSPSYFKTLKTQRLKVIEDKQDIVKTST
jgi:AraC-like DNA-binding protein